MAAEIETLDGPMFQLRLISDLTNPKLEPVGEVLMNNEYWYLWRDHFWAVAEYADSRVDDVESSSCRHPEKDYIDLVVHCVGRQIEEDEDGNDS
jgi:hypothetical protein